MATNLVAGDLIADIDGGAAVKVVTNALTQTSETVYNFEVEGAHSYFADELGLWVHNAPFKFGRITEIWIRFILEGFGDDPAKHGFQHTVSQRPSYEAQICDAPTLEGISPPKNFWNLNFSFIINGK